MAILCWAAKNSLSGTTSFLLSVMFPRIVDPRVLQVSSVSIPGQWVHPRWMNKPTGGPPPPPFRLRVPEVYSILSILFFQIQIRWFFDRILSHFQASLFNFPFSLFEVRYHTLLSSVADS